MCPKKSIINQHLQAKKDSLMTMFCPSCNSILEPEGWENKSGYAYYYTCPSCETTIPVDDAIPGPVHKPRAHIDSDMVNHPKHYLGNGLEAIDVIESFKLDFNLGNAVKYILRAGRKGDAMQDIEKAIWYLKRAIHNAASEDTATNT